MKTIRFINILILITLALLLLGSSIDSELGLFFLLGLLVLGAYQGLMGLILLLVHRTHRGIQLYVGGLVLVGLLMSLPSTWLWMIPPIPLALYFTFLLDTLKPRDHSEQRLENRKHLPIKP